MTTGNPPETLPGEPGDTSSIVRLDSMSLKRLDGWNAFFLVMTVLTSVTGFFFPRNGITPGQIVGAISLILLVVAVLARYPLHFSGAGRWLYVITAILAQYFNFAVLMGLFGLGLGAILRRSAAAMAVYAGVALVLPSLLIALPGNLWRFGPIIILGNSVGAVNILPGFLAPWAGFAAMAAYATAALVGGGVLLARRDT